MLMFGREIDLPLDVAFGLPTNHVFGTEEYCQTLRERLEDSFEYVRDALQKSAERRKRYYDTSRRGKQYEEGELVWLFNPQRKIGKSPKLQKCWSGPFKIVKKLNDILYQIRKRDKLKVVHYNNLKRYHSKTLEVEKECNIVKDYAENIEPGRSDESPDLYLCESSDEDISTAGVRLAKPGSLVNSKNFCAEFLVSSGGRSEKPGDLVASPISCSEFPVSFERVRPDIKPDGLVTSPFVDPEFPVTSEDHVDKRQETQSRPQRIRRVPKRLIEEI
jgi:hypothetical protein